MARGDDAAGTVMLAFVLGTITGAAVALLMAPATGEETRRVLAERAREGRERANDAARQGRELVNRGKETLSSAIDRGREAYEQARTGAVAEPAAGAGESVTTGWSEVFLGIIAFGALVSAIFQIGMAIAALRVAKEARQMMASVQQEVRPLMAKANAAADEASRTLALATAQAQKVDRLVTDLSRRVEETASVIQEAIVTPAREGLAMVAAVRAGLGALRGWRGISASGRRSADEEDPLFIG